MTQTALIVAHGQPSDPGPAEAALAGLAAQVAVHLPRWRVLSATLAAPGALSAALRAAGAGGGLVYPMFMAEGWFTRGHLPERLASACDQALFDGKGCDRAGCGGDAGCARWRVLAPFGLDVSVQALAVTIVQEAGATAGEVLLAAHGSSRSAAPSEVAYTLARKLTDALTLARCEAAFIDQSPRLAEVAGFGPDALCLPFFAAEGEHVTDDLPDALTEAGFRGRVLPALGRDGRVPGLIAQALAKARQSEVS